MTTQDLTSTVVSRDGTTIAVDRYGSGPAIALAGGAFTDRRALAPFAQALAPYFTVLAYDRRGRGDSGDTPPYALAREIEDLAAVIAAAGGPACVFGHSSGAGLAVLAAAGRRRPSAGWPCTSRRTWWPRSDYAPAGRPGRPDHRAGQFGPPRRRG